MIRQLSVVGLLTILAGCSDEPKIYHVKGTVSYGDEPLAAGAIYFDPVPGENKGPQGAAPIKDGTYDTAALGGKGITGGQYIIRIEGYSAERSDGEAKPTKVLFKDFTQQVDLPKAASEQNFNVPIKKK